MTVLAPAKINLVLEVCGKRADGYHDIRSIILPVSLYDRIEIARTDTPAIETRILPTGSIDERRLGLAGADDNLATRAARLLQARTGSRLGATMGIEKHIPPGGGLGGGSSDAAAVLRALNDLWGVGLDVAALADLGAEIGCDVPAQVHDRLVGVAGRGERVTPLMFDPDAAGAEPWWLVLLNPGFPVPTRDVYACYTPPLTSPGAIYTRMISAVQERSLSGLAGALFNDLQATVVRKYPLIEMLLEGLMEHGALGSLLSGSGGSVFGLARDEGHAREMLTAVRAAFGAGLWGRAVRMLPDGVMAAHGPLEARV